MPGAIAQGLIWGIMAIGLYITYKVLDYSDLTVDGTMATGGAVCIMLMMQGLNVWIALLCAIVAGMLAGLATGLFHTAMGIPPILAGILTQLSLYSINLTIMLGKANQAVSVLRPDISRTDFDAFARRSRARLNRSHFDTLQQRDWAAFRLRHLNAT